MMDWGRRNTLTGLATFPLTFTVSQKISAQSVMANIVIIGGGFGGASAAMFLKKISPDLNITLVEPKTSYYACPFSNLLIDGKREITNQKFSYEGLKSRGVNVIHLRAIDVDPVKKTVTLSESQTLSYDKLIISPGIAFQTNAIDGYGELAQKSMPHAWAGGQDIVRLVRRLKNINDGSTVVISVPQAPYRCPPGPYERASLIASYLKQNKPKSKLIILDGKENFSKQALFERAWAELYPNIIEWRSASNDGRVVSVDASKNQVITDFETLNVGLANIIPPQKAGHIAEVAGLVDITGWCPINPVDFSSTLQNDIYVIGDATIAAPMPKSAFSAAVHAKICAIQILRNLKGLEPQPTILSNTCYSFIAPERAVSITGVYSNSGKAIQSVPGAGGTTPLTATVLEKTAEAYQANIWFQSMTHNAFGSI